MTEIRPLTRRDHAVVLALNAQAQPAVATLDRVELARLSGLSTAHLALADASGKLLGYALLFPAEAAYDGEEFRTLKDLFGGSMLYVDQVVVAAEARRRGLGRLLYARITQAARARDLQWVCCEVNTAPPNPASLAFHRRLGFAEIGAFATADGREVALLLRQTRDG